MNVCSQCSHWVDGDILTTQSCSNPEYLKFDPVDGYHYQPCRALRDEGGQCGPEGAGFKPIPARPSAFEAIARWRNGLYAALAKATGQ